MIFIQKTKDGVLGIFEYMPHAVQAVGPALYPGRLLHGHAGTCTCVYTLDEIEQTKLIHTCNFFEGTTSSIAREYRAA